MEKYADKAAMQRYANNIENALATKARSNHKHDRVNGYKVVISDTVPTENDETVITLIVDAAHVPEIPAVDISFEENHQFIDKTLFRYVYGYISVPYTLKKTEFIFNAYVDGEPVDAEFQVLDSDYWGEPSNVVMDYSRSSYITLASSSNTYYVNVKVDDTVKQFKVTLSDWITDSDELFFPYRKETGAAGLYINDSLIKDYSGDDLLDASEIPSEKLEYRYAVNDPLTIADTQNIELYIIPNADLPAVTVRDPALLPALSDSRYKVNGDWVIDGGSATIRIEDFNPPLDESIPWHFVTKVLFNNGYTVYTTQLYLTLEQAYTDHWSDYWIHHAVSTKYLNYTTYEDYDPNADNKLSVAKPYTSITGYYGNYMYLTFEFSKPLRYDINVSLVDKSDVPLTQSTIVPLDMVGTPKQVSEFTIPARRKQYHHNLYHAITTPGTYRFFADMSGGGFEESLMFEFTVS